MTIVPENSVHIFPDRIEKRYQSLERYESEGRNIALFEGEGFRVPKILSSDRGAMTRTISRVEGTISDVLSLKEIYSCLDVLKHIYVTFHDRFNKSEVGLHYIASLQTGVREFVETRGHYTLSEDNFGRAIDLMARHFRVTLFKDAKSSNWVFTNKGLFLIDFDYVRPSFFLSDLAQLLNYSGHIDADEVRKILAYFVDNIDVEQDVTETLLKLSRVNSYIMALKYGPQTTQERREEFERSIIHTLKQLGVIYEE